MGNRQRALWTYGFGFVMDGPHMMMAHVAEVAYGCGRIAMFAQKAEVKNHPLEGARLT